MGWPDSTPLSTTIQDREGNFLDPPFSPCRSVSNRMPSQHPSSTRGKTHTSKGGGNGHPNPIGNGWQRREGPGCQGTTRDWVFSLGVHPWTLVPRSDCTHPTPSQPKRDPHPPRGPTPASWKDRRIQDTPKRSYSSVRPYTPCSSWPPGGSPGTHALRTKNWATKTKGGTGTVESCRRCTPRSPCGPPCGSTRTTEIESLERWE